MTVAELIEKLKQMPQDATAIRYGNNWDWEIRTVEPRERVIGDGYDEVIIR